MNAAQTTEPLAMPARGVGRTPLPHMPGMPSFDGESVPAFIEKCQSLMKSTNCGVTASAVIGHFPYSRTEDVCEMVIMLPAYCRNEGSQS